MQKDQINKIIQDYLALEAHALSVFDTLANLYPTRYGYKINSNSHSFTGVDSIEFTNDRVRITTKYSLMRVEDDTLEFEFDIKLLSLSDEKLKAYIDVEKRLDEKRIDVELASMEYERVKKGV